MLRDSGKPAQANEPVALPEPAVTPIARQALEITAVPSPPPCPSLPPPSEVVTVARPTLQCAPSYLSPNILPGNKDGTDVAYVATLVPAAALEHEGEGGDVAFGIHAHSTARSTGGCIDLVLHTVRTRYPHAVVYVADDGKVFGALQGVVSVSVEGGAGAATVRTALLDRAASDGHAYLFLLDDTTLLSADVDVRRLLRVMHCTNAHVIAPDLCDRLPFNKQRCVGGSSFITVAGDAVEVARYTSVHPERIDGCMRVELPPRVMLVRTGARELLSWDQKLRDNEHYDAFYAGREDLNAWVCPHMHAVSISHGCNSVNATAAVGVTEHSASWSRDLPRLVRKLRVPLLYDEWGKPFSSSGAEDDAAVCSSKDDVLALALKASGMTTDDLRGELSALMDAAVPHTHTRTAVCFAQACVQPTASSIIVRGNVIAEYDNTVVWSRDRIHTDNRVLARIPTSPTAVATFISLMHEEKGPFLADATTRPLAFVTASRNGYCYVYRLLVSILGMVYSGSTVTFVLVDFDSDDGDYDALIEWAHTSALSGAAGASEPDQSVLNRCFLSANVRTKDVRRQAADAGIAVGSFTGAVLRMHTAFSRSLGLARGIEHAATLLPSHAVVFIADSAMLLPVDMPQRILRMVRCGSSVYAPIAMKNTQVGSHRKALLFRGASVDGRRVYSGFGMLGFCLSDYAAVGGMDPAFTFHHGGEDIDTIERFAAGRFFIARPKERGYWHSQHKDESLLAYKSAANPARALSVVSVLQPLQKGHVMYAGVEQWLASIDPVAQLLALWYAYPASSHLTSHSGRMMAVMEGDDRVQRVLWLHAGFGPQLLDFQSWEKASSSSRACRNTNAYVPASAENDAGEQPAAPGEDEPASPPAGGPRRRIAPVQAAPADAPVRQTRIAQQVEPPPAARKEGPVKQNGPGGTLRGTGDAAAAKGERQAQANAPVQSKAERPAAKVERPPPVEAKAKQPAPQEEQEEDQDNELMAPAEEQQAALLNMSV